MRTIDELEASKNLSVATALIFVMLVLTSGHSYAKTTIHNQTSNVAGVTPAEIPNHPTTSSLANTSVGEEVNVYAEETKEPAPMGIVDYGIGPNGAYQYSTTAFLGVADIYSLSTENSSSYPSMSFQLNVNLVFTSQTGEQYTYWIQDVAQINTAIDSIQILDNVWNSSARGVGISSSGISGNGQVAVSGSGQTATTYYYDRASTSLPGSDNYFSLPLIVQFEVISILSSLGQPQVVFYYNDGYGYETFDTVTFPEVENPSMDSGFLVSGLNYNPEGLFDDAELIMGGVSGGESTTASQSNVELHLKYWNGYNFQGILNAYNFGSDTAEGISNVLSEGYELDANGSLLAQVSPGSGSLGVLYTQSQIATVSVESSLSSGTLYIVNESYTSVKGVGFAFTGDEVNITAFPGTYELYVYNSQGTLVAQGSETLSAGQSLTLRISSTTFVSAVEIPLTVSYSIVGGGSSYSAPTFTYVSNGVQQTMTLSTTPVTVSADSGSLWSVTNLLSGSTSAERWITTQSTSGTVSSAQTIVFGYTNEYLVTFTANPSSDGSTSPTGSNWYDAGQTYSISATAVPPYFLSSWTATAPLSIANPSSSSTTVLISGSGTVTANFASISISLNSQASTITQGSSIQVTGTAKGGGQSATLSVSGLPTGSTPTLSSNTLTLSTSGAEFTLTIGTSYSATAGTFTVTVTSTVSGVGSTSTQYTLTIRQAIPLTLGYFVSGSGSGYSAPTITYVYNGTSSQVSLGSTPSVIYTDQNSQWSVTNALSGSTSTERWETNQTTSGNDLSAETINLVYYHQFFVEFSYSVVGGGSGYTAPAATTVQFGSELSATLGQKTWVDAGSQYSYINPLAGSMQTERWEASNASSPTGQISSSTTISPSYYKQFSISIAFSVLNGGLPPVGPTFTSESFGVTDSSTLTGTPTSYWTDAGSNYNASSVLTATQERWITDSSTTGTVTSPLSLNFVYDHQYYLAMQSSQSGGTISPASEWINAGNTISISNSASQGWKFEFWTGSGTGSYSGSSGSTTIEVQAPIKENATFYVGLTIGTTSGGSILYSYGNSGSSHVTTQAQVYVPDGSVVTLNGNPSSFLYKLDSWSGVATGTSSQTTITINSPSTVQAQFGYNIVSIGGIIAVIVVAIFGIVAVMMRRKPG